MSSSMEQDRMIGGIKNDNGTWYVMIRYQDWTGARKQKCKRGFSTRKEAADWELQFKLQKKASVDMTMEMIIPGLSEPPVRTLRATIPGNESQLKFLILDD